MSRFFVKKQAKYDERFRSVADKNSIQFIPEKSFFTA